MTAVATREPASRPTVPQSPGELLRIPLEQLVESPWNPRKHFDPAKLAETAESLRVNGQLTPITVRQTPNRRGELHATRYEIGAGHRRFRAAPQAGLTSLLAVVRPLDDVAFLELLTVENKQREDVTPLDEAAGFKLLMEKAGYDVPKLAARIGLSTKYVYDRLKLLQLIPAAKNLLEAGTITAGHAILLARLTREDQGRAIDTDEGGLFQDEHVHSELELGVGDESIKPRSVRELETWINNHIRLKPEAVDPFLFPETAQQLAGATQARLKVVHVTHDWTAHSDVRHDGTKDRVYGEQSWKRADGLKKSKTCPYSALGVVVSGYGQGEAFRVCVNRDRCMVHWPKRKATAAVKAAGKDPYVAQQERERRAREREQQEKARWNKATPTLLKALAAKIKTGDVRPGTPIWHALLTWAGQRRRGKGEVQPGTTGETLARYMAYTLVAFDLSGYSWRPWQEFPGKLKPFGVDAQMIVDQVAPEPAAAKAKKTPTKTPTKKKGGSRAARRS